MPRASTRPLAIACFGEALWDILPRGIFLGGAPLNVAYHLSRQGVRAWPVGAVGRDFLGDEARRRIADWGLPVDAVARLASRPTGTVRAALDRAGVATYRIARDVAWDRIRINNTLRRGPPPAAVVYGSLALRQPANRRELARAFSLWPQALRVLDLNLRAPFDRGPAIPFALRHAQLLKLNADELARVAGRPAGSPAQMARAAQAFAGRHALARICVTAGAQGAGLWWDGRWCWEPGRRVEVRDTVGAGDAFLAGFLASLLARRADPAVALAHACRLGEFVAGCDGATPPYRCDARGLPRATEA